ncbi:MAG: CsbD family protein [Candidatus Dormibacteraeota bacterium]|nr:CsbD family protein [Candidatus Dormibacteraeota bacterium]
MKDKIKGKAEEVKGKVTGDKTEEFKGKGRQGVGDVKGKAKEVGYDAEHRGTRKV